MTSSPLAIGIYHSYPDRRIKKARQCRAFVFVILGAIRLRTDWCGVIVATDCDSNNSADQAKSKKATSADSSTAAKSAAKKTTAATAAAASTATEAGSRSRSVAVV